MRVKLSSIISILAVQSFIIRLLCTKTQAQPMPGDALVIDPGAGTNNAATVIVQVNGQTTNPNPTSPPTNPDPDNPGGDNTTDGSNNSGCSLLAENPKGDQSAFNLGLLVLPANNWFKSCEKEEESFLKSYNKKLK